MSAFLRRLRARIRYRHFQGELSREIDVHRDMKRAEFEADGLSPEAARQRTARDLGNVTLMREESRGIWLAPWLESVWQDTRYAWRSLKANPGFALTVFTTLVLAIGLNTSLFSVVNTLLLRPWQVPNADRMVLVYQSNRPQKVGADLRGVSPAEYRFLQERVTSTELAASHDGSARIGFEPKGTTSSVRFVSGNYFPVLQLPIRLGRGLRAGDDQLSQKARVAVLSEGLWQGAFGADPAIVGRDVRLNDLAFTVVGVAGRDGTTTPGDRPTHVWVPLAVTPDLYPNNAFWEQFLLDREHCCVSLAGRLRDGATRQATQAELTVLDRQFRGEADTDALGMRVVGTSLLNRPEANNIVPVFALLFAGVAMVLLLACANVGNLQLARAMSRRREVTIRMSLGASRRRVIRQFLTEGLLLALAAGAVSIGLARVLPQLILNQLDPNIGQSFAGPPDARLFLFVLAIAVAVCLLSGLAPALRSTRQVSVGRYGDHGRVRLRSVLLATQVVISSVLLIGAGLLTRGIQHAATFDLGFDVDATTVVSIARDPTPPAEQRAFSASVMDAIAASGIAPVGITALAPLSNTRMATGARLPAEADRDQRRVQIHEVSPGYFDVLGLSLKSGRHATPQDTTEIVVNETFAVLFWPAGDAVGQPISLGVGHPRVATLGWHARRVVGVVADAHIDSASELGPTFFQEAGDSMAHLVIRNDPMIAERVRAIIARADPDAVVTVTPLADNLRRSLRESRMGATIAGGLGLLALVLASIGIFGVFAFVVIERTREIGIRVAIGARRSDVLRLLLRRAAVPLGAGLGVGFVISLATAPVLESYLYGISPHDTIAFLGVAGILGLAALAATFLPVRRAVAVDPAITLRHD